MSFTAEKHKKRKQTMTTALAQYFHDVFEIWGYFSCFFFMVFMLTYTRKIRKNHRIIMGPRNMMLYIYRKVASIRLSLLVAHPSTLDLFALNPFKLQYSLLVSL